MNNSNPYYVAAYGGFLVIETYAAPDMRLLTKAYTITDARSATTWPDFEAADAAAKWAVNQLYPPDLRYFAILQPAFA